MNGPRIASIALVALLIIGALFLLIQAGRFVAGSIGGDDSNDEQTTSTTRESQPTELENYIDSETTAIYIRDGEINANETHYRIEFTVNPASRELKVIKGYGDNVVLSETFPNTFSAYEAFMHALEFEGILRTQNAAYASSRGVCPNGDRVTYKLDSSGIDDDFESWSSSCSSRHGTFKGDRSGIKNLFEKQIPEYRKLTRDYRL